ncbi:Nucleotide exchange factor SIL1 [Cytospora mali]|uniref:Nucleotide exchange factor SIL1 n=1 Tax=Cytospora mali TaxID=578113 RepID=A0A194VUJ4_CYTMA|nr:Nucleotide exchange factor SIL1 [Valsa mali]
MMSPRQATSRRPAGPAFAFIIFLIFAMLTFGASAATKETDHALICHSDDPTECYPKIFQATNDFQEVHIDQDLPPGLHVRLDVNTGRREAKLNDPNEQDPALEGLPVDSSVVLVEHEEGSHDAGAPSELRIPKGAPQYEPIGKVKTPQQESQAFHDSLTVLKTLALNDRPIDAALDILKDISHDIYYGLKIAEDTNAIKELLCMMSSQEVFSKDGKDIIVCQAGQAASIVGAALQNNQKALAEVESYWETISQTTCAGTDRKLGYAVFNMLMPGVSSGEIPSGSEADRLSLTKAKAGALRGLIKSPTIRDDFLANGGMAQVLRILVLERPDMAPAQQKLANLVLDTFLDESMGAIPGVWPRAGDVDHNWDYQLRTLAKLHKADKEHWSVELWKRLQEQRKAAAQSGNRRTEHNEL